MDTNSKKSREFKQFIDEIYDRIYKQFTFDSTTIRVNQLHGEQKEMAKASLTILEKYKKKFGLDLFLLILNGKVKIGMTKEMAILAWGKPKDINETILKNLKSEQWVYSDGGYIYFTNNILSAIQ